MVACIESGIEITSNSLRIAKAGSEIIRLSNANLGVVTVALRTIENFGSTVLCWIGAKDLPINHVRTIIRYLNEGTTVTLASKLFCNIITGTKEFCEWANRIGISPYVVATVGTFEVYGKQIAVVAIYLLSKPVQDVAGILSSILDFAYQCQQIAAKGANVKIAIIMSQDIVKLVSKGMSFCGSFYVWRVAIDACTIYTSSTSLLKMCI